MKRMRTAEQKIKEYETIEIIHNRIEQANFNAAEQKMTVPTRWGEQEQNKIEQKIR